MCFAEKIPSVVECLCLLATLVVSGVVGSVGADKWEIFRKPMSDFLVAHYSRQCTHEYFSFTRE